MISPTDLWLYFVRWWQVDSIKACWKLLLSPFFVLSDFWRFCVLSLPLLVSNWGQGWSQDYQRIVYSHLFAKLYRQRVPNWCSTFCFPDIILARSWIKAKLDWECRVLSQNWEWPNQKNNPKCTLRSFCVVHSHFMLVLSHNYSLSAATSLPPLNLYYHLRWQTHLKKWIPN